MEDHTQEEGDGSALSKNVATPSRRKLVLGRHSLSIRLLNRRRSIPDRPKFLLTKVVAFLLFLSFVGIIVLCKHSPSPMPGPALVRTPIATASIRALLSPTSTPTSGPQPTPTPSLVGPQIPINTPSPNGPQVPNGASTPTIELTPTNVPSPTPATLFWGFDGSTQGWGTSEGAFKLATVSDVSNPVSAGSGSLEVMTTLTGAGNPAYNGNSVYTHTEAANYFSPQNLGNATASCFVYLPPGLAPNGTAPGYVQLFVKDTQYRNDFNNGITINASATGSWLDLSFAISLGSADAGFDVTQVSAIGIRVVLYDGVTLNYTGPFYIDSCSIGA